MRASVQQALDTWKTCLAVGTLTAQANSVVAYRSLGMLGGWSVETDENQRMVQEKPAVFLEANWSAGLAFLAGKRVDQVTQAWITPLTRTVESNRARLETRGPAGPGLLLKTLHDNGKALDESARETT